MVASAVLNDVPRNNPSTEADRELSNTKLYSFAVFAMRWFVKFDHSLGIGVFSGQLEEALIRTANNLMGAYDRLRLGISAHCANRQSCY